MKSNEYAFITHWRVQSTCQEISDILGNAPDLTRWWPSVYLDVQELEPGDKNGIGKVVSLFTKGWLPYTLRWSFRVTESRDALRAMASRFPIRHLRRFVSDDDQRRIHVFRPGADGVFGTAPEDADRVVEHLLPVVLRHLRV